MKVLLLEDVYKLGRAGDVKRVAPGYARNYLMPQGLAVLATPGAMKHADRIKKTGEVKRAKVNQELGGVAEQLEGKRFTFAAKASETRRLYGSINTQMIAEAVSKEIGVDVQAKQIESQPLRMLGRHSVAVRLTVDLIPEIEIVVHREGETPESALEAEAMEALMAEEEEALAEILEDEAEMEQEEASDEDEQTAEVEFLDESGEDAEEDEAA
ncbi:MAG: 50S ribosomal protein L9 [Anaerolineales bacterium]|jgi:large subunit ribosomal protein L9